MAHGACEIPAQFVEFLQTLQLEQDCTFAETAVASIQAGGNLHRYFGYVLKSKWYKLTSTRISQ